MTELNLETQDGCAVMLETRDKKARVCLLDCDVYLNVSEARAIRNWLTRFLEEHEHVAPRSQMARVTE